MGTLSLGRSGGFAHLLLSFSAFFLTITVLFSTIQAKGQGNSGYTYTVTAATSNNWYNLGTNQSLLIPSNITFTGGVNWNGEGARVYNNGTWKGNDVSLQKRCAIYTSASSVTELGNLNLNDGVEISIMGSLRAGVNWNGQGATITIDGSWTCPGSIPVGTQGKLVIGKKGRLTCQDLNLNSTGGEVHNWGELSISNCQVSSGTTLRNYNKCTVTGHTNNTGTLYNEGYWKCTDYNNNKTTNNCGSIEVSAGYHNNGGSLLINTGKLATRELINDSDIQGPTDGKSVGKVVVVRQENQELCRQNGSGRFAVTGRLDLSRCKPGQFNDLLSNQIGIKGWDIETGRLGDYYSYNASQQIGGCTNQTLPVELVSFTAQVRGAAVVLNWRTASEKNNDHFVVERSLDGTSFQPLATVPGAGTTSTPTSYTATDSQPLAGSSYYRLRQLDTDGSVSYAPVVSVQLAATAAEAAYQLQAYPNPAADQLTLDLRNLPAAPTRAQVRNLAGLLVAEQPLTDGALAHLNLTSLPAGVYVLQVHTAGTTLTQRVVKQ